MAEDMSNGETGITDATSAESAGEVAADSGMTSTEAAMGSSAVDGGSVTAGADAAGDGNFWDSFTDEGLRNNPSVRKHANAEALAKSYVELSRKLGQRGDIPLPKDATPEQVEARRALRRGENIKSVEDYTWKLSAADARDMLPDADKAFDGIAKSLYEAGLDDETFAAAMKGLTANAKAQKAEIEASYAKSEAELRDEWNEDYDINMRANKMFVSKNFPEVHSFLEKTGLYTDKNVAKMFRRINEMTADGQIRVERATEKSFEDKMAELTKSDAYRQSWHPDHDKAVAARTRMIMEMAERRRR